jgi:hypothetical protein
MGDALLVAPQVMLKLHHLVPDTIRLQLRVYA